MPMAAAQPMIQAGNFLRLRTPTVMGTKEAAANPYTPFYAKMPASFGGSQARRNATSPTAAST